MTTPSSLLVTRATIRYLFLQRNGVVAGYIGETAGVRSVPIKFEVDGKRRTLKVPSAIELTIEGIEGADKSKESTISNPPMLVAPGFAAVVAKSTENSYSDHGMKWDNSGKNESTTCPSTDKQVRFKEAGSVDYFSDSG